MGFQKGYQRTSAQATATSKALHDQAVARNAGNPVGRCPKCGSTELIKYGIDRNGRHPRQRYACPNFHTMLVPREYPLGKGFQSEPHKLLKALRLMKSGRKTLQKIADAVELDRYTIYKLHNHIGRPFNCVCLRPLGHRGHCKYQFDRSKAVREALDDARSIRRISKPNARAYKVAERALSKLVNQLKEMEDNA